VAVARPPAPENGPNTRERRPRLDRPGCRFRGHVCVSLTHEPPGQHPDRGSTVAPLTASGLTKDGIESAADALQTATKTFISDVKSVAAPHTAAGTQAKTAIGSPTSRTFPPVS
jgi:hypothetical protein